MSKTTPAESGDLSLSAVLEGGDDTQDLAPAQDPVAVAAGQDQEEEGWEDAAALDPGQADPAVEAGAQTAAPAEAAATAEAASGAQGAQDGGPKEPFWARSALRGYEKQIADLKRQLGEKAEAAPQQQEQDTPEPPDPIDDPEGYRRFVRNETLAVAHQVRMDTLSELFLSKHGEDTWNEMMDWAQTRPDIVSQSRQARNPYEWVRSQYEREKVAAEVGDDPKAWRDAEREKLRAELLAEITGDGAETAASTTRKPLIPGPASTQRSAPARQGSGPEPLSSILGESR